MKGQYVIDLAKEILHARATVNEASVVLGTSHPTTTAAKLELARLRGQAKDLFRN